MPEGNEGGSQGGQGGNEGGNSGGAGSQENVLADLHNERKARQAAESRAKDVEERLSKIEESNKSEREKELDKTRNETREQTMREAETKANTRIIKSEVKRLAAEKLVDPSDALGALDLSQFEVNDDGDVDEKAINAELDRLVREKPHWAKANAGKNHHGSADQGARGQGTSGTDMNALLRSAAGVR